MRTIQIEAETLKLQAELNESRTADAVWNALPFSSHANLWGDEIYFTIPVSAEKEPEAKVEVDEGTIAYWPVGNAFCIFFGLTPASKGSRPCAYSPVNIIGKLSSDPKVLKAAKDQMKVSVSRTEQV